MRRTTGLLAVTKVMLDDPDGRHYGWDLSRASRTRSATVYRVLSRMLEAGWITDGWEDPVEINGRPPRRYYTVTDLGRIEMATLQETP
jgi:PadR family transcriptional regulator PadR